MATRHDRNAGTTHGNGRGVRDTREETEHETVNEHEKVEVANSPVTARDADEEADAADHGALLGAHLVLDLASNHHGDGLSHDTDGVQPSGHVGRNTLLPHAASPERTALFRTLWMYEIMYVIMLEAVYTVPMDMCMRIPPRIVRNALWFIPHYHATTEDKYV